MRFHRVLIARIPLSQRSTNRNSDDRLLSDSILAPRDPCGESHVDDCSLEPTDMPLYREPLTFATEYEMGGFGTMAAKGAPASATFWSAAKERFSLRRIE